MEGANSLLEYILKTRKKSNETVKIKLESDVIKINKSQLESIFNTFMNEGKSRGKAAPVFGILYPNGEIKIAWGFQTRLTDLEDPTKRQKVDTLEKAIRLHYYKYDYYSYVHINMVRLFREKRVGDAIPIVAFVMDLEMTRNAKYLMTDFKAFIRQYLLCYGTKYSIMINYRGKKLVILKLLEKSECYKRVEVLEYNKNLELRYKEILDIPITRLDILSNKELKRYSKWELERFKKKVEENSEIIIPPKGMSKFFDKISKKYRKYIEKKCPNLLLESIY